MIDDRLRLAVAARAVRRELERLSFSVVSLAGQNPNLTGSADCSVVGPYLAGA